MQVVEIEIDRPEAGNVAKTVSLKLARWHLLGKNIVISSRSVGSASVAFGPFAHNGPQPGYSSSLAFVTALPVEGSLHCAEGAVATISYTC